MSLIESARDLVKGLVTPEPEVGEHDTSSRGQRDPDGAPTAIAAPSDDVIVVDEAERLRREWETQPGHH